MESKQDKQLAIETDDGRRLTVNVAQVDVHVLNNIQVNQEIVITGNLQGNQMTAQSVQVAGASQGAAENREATHGQASGKTETMGQISSQQHTAQPKSGTEDTSGAASPRTTASEPQSKDDCKDGGWQRFGHFKNQGECVSSFNRGERHRK